MRNEKGLTLVELLAVIVILAIIAIIAVTSVTTIIKHTRTDTHLTKARNVLDVRKLAYSLDEPPNAEREFGGTEIYTLKDLADMGYLKNVLQTPSFFPRWEDENSLYDMEESLVVLDKGNGSVTFKINLNIGGKNFIFDAPLLFEDIKRENLSQELNHNLI